MPTYQTEIDGKTYKFEAADPVTAATAIDEAKTQKAIAPIAKYTGEVFSGDPARANRAISREEGRQAGPGVTAGLGLQAGTLRNFNDELAGLSEASGLPVGTPPIVSGPVGAARIGLEKLGVGNKGAGERYDVGLNRLRGFYEGAQEANPKTALGSEIVGGMAGPNPAAAGLSVPQRMAQGALVAGTEGLVAGAGAGEGEANRATGAGVGAGVGATLGATLPFVGNVAGKLYRAVVPHSEEQIAERAARQTAETMRRDLARMTPEQRAALQAGEQAGQPLVLGDLGGEGTRTLARTSANQSDEARAALKEVTGGRFADQGQRSSTWWDQITDAPRALQAREQLQDAATMANRPAYQRAYAKGEGGVWDDVLQGLTTSPAVRKAIKDAEATGADRAAVQGFKAPRNPFQTAEDGTLALSEGATPTLQFWDHVQRNLRSVADTAKRAGDNETADRVGQLRRALNNHLDAAVPEFGQARKGAAAWFGADDALEAGQTFLGQKLNGGHGEAAQAFKQMNPHEQQLFRQGVIEDVRNRMHALSDNQDISQLFKSPEMRDRLRLALGPELMTRLQGHLDVEQTMTKLKRAVSGQSTTAQQQLAAGAVGAAGGQWFGDDPLTKTGNATVGAVAGAMLARGNAKLSQRVATHIGNLLASDDPADWQRVAVMAQRNPAINRAWNELKNYSQRAAAQQAGTYGAEEMR
jgi:hypothetical protein